MTQVHAEQLGERVRILRLKRGMTQKTLAGDHMTRNMLSLIENGTALPSLPTLLYLSDMLAMPVGYFFATSDAEVGRYFKETALPEIRALFAGEKYKECVARIQTLPAFAADDEVFLMAAISHLHIALRFVGDFAMRSAQSSLKNAADALLHTVYAGEDLRRSIQFYKDFFPLLSSFSELPERVIDLRFAGAYVPVDMLLYLNALRAYPLKNSANRETAAQREYPSAASLSAFPKDSVLYHHLSALSAAATGRNTAALRILRELSADTTLPYFMRYRVLCDLEEAAGGQGEFRTAYAAARRKLDLLEDAKK